MQDGWVFDGGRICLDLVNTLRDRTRGGRELLTGPAAVAEWLLAAGLVTRRPRVTHRHVTDLVELRGSIDSVLMTLSAGGTPERDHVRLLNRTARSAPLPVPQLLITSAGEPTQQQHRPGDQVAAALVALAADAIELATAGITVRECAANDCGLRFADLSPKGNRHWCSMARCGNRAKVRTHYARSRDRS